MTLLRTIIDVLRYVMTHPANRGRRIRAVARALAFQVRGRLRHRSTVTLVGQSMRLEVPLHAHGASKAVYANPPDYAEMLVWRRILRPGDVFVDVGSNVGVYSLWAADCGAHPVAVEPDEANADLTRRNLRRNGLTPEVHEVALGSEPGTSWFTTSADAENHLSLEAGIATRPVAVTTLDLVLDGRTARGVKVDVEGAERLVVDGARGSLAAGRIDVLQLEWNRLSVPLLGETRAPLRRLLESHGYVLRRPTADGSGWTPVAEDDESDVDVFALSPAAARELAAD